LPEFFQQALGLAGVGAQPYARRPALLVVPNDPGSRQPSLQAREKEAVHVYQRSLLLTDLPALNEPHRDVMEVPELRGARHPLQTVEGERIVVVFPGGVKEAP
jgi:hypothetical protein